MGVSGDKRIGRVGVALGVAAMLLLSLAGCVHQLLPATVSPLEVSQIVGTWVHFEDDDAVSEITFDADGGVELDFPEADLIQFFGASEFVDGTWEIQQASDGRWLVVLFGESADGENLDNELGGLDRASGMVLFLTLGDPDEARYYEFERAPAS